MKNWLTQRFLPLWAKETVLRENRLLKMENARLRSNVQVLESYIRGLHKGVGRRRETSYVNQTEKDNTKC